MRTKRKQQGFTLLEIMLVVSIIVIILGVAISKLGNTTGIAKSMRVQADVQAIKTQLQLYESMNGFFPTTEQGLQALVTQPQNDPRPTRWYQLFKEMPKDPWGSDYIYRDPGLKNPGGYDLYSAGPDRQPDTADDDWGQWAACGTCAWLSRFSTLNQRTISSVRSHTISRRTDGGRIVVADLDYADPRGARDFKTWEHDCHRQNHARSSGRPGDQDTAADCYQEYERIFPEQPSKDCKRW